MSNPYQTPSHSAANESPSTSQTNEKIGDNVGMRILLPVGRSGWAIAAGYLGLFSFLIIPSPIALIISIIAIQSIRKSKTTPSRKHGMGRAIFGLIMGLIGTILLIAMIINFVVLAK